MSKYKPIKWENVPTTTLTATDFISPTSPTDISEMIKPMKISYICKNCNGHINPTTMKCEYCDTQY